MRPHLDRGTLTGCLGILCVLALPMLLFLPVESWNLPLWLLRLVPLVAVGMAALGTWLLTRVPASPAARSSDPLHPLTSEGFPPVIEQPARHANRVGLIIACVLILIGVLGYILTTFGASDIAVFTGTLLASAAGAVLLLYGVLAARCRLAVPAWRWIRVPIQEGLVHQVLPLTLIGLVALVWALFIAEEQGYIWAPIGIGVLILGSALLGPVTQRLPRQR
ncbi:MAG: hypothetical protein ACXWQR_17800 [Ktedonobacterales bacterium]